MKKHLAIFNIFFLLVSCQSENNQCKDVYPEKRFIGTGYIFYFRTSQDAMADFWFFPSCNNNKNKDIFLTVDYKKGISFKLPLTGHLYSKISQSFQHIVLEEGSFFKNVWYVPVSIDFEKTTQSLFHSSERNNNWTCNLKLKNKQLVLSYFVTDEITINQIEPIL